MKKPKIAFIVPDKIQNPVGGMGVQAKYLIKHLQKDFDFDIYGFPENNKLKNYHPCFNPLPKIRHHGLSTIGGQITYLTEIVKNEKPDLIHVADYTIYLAGVMASRALKIPLIVSVQLSAHLMEQFGLKFSIDHNSIDGQAIQNTMKEIELLGLREAQKIIHVSKTYKNIFAKEMPELDNKSIYIPNGVDLQEWNNSKKVKLPGKQKIKLVYLGRFNRQKNIQELAQVNVPNNIDLIFVGDEKTADINLLEIIKIRSKNEENIHYYGPAYDQDKINIMSSADAIIIPSIHECHPIIMHEALASKSVVLSSFVSDMSVVLDEIFAINCGLTKESIENSLIQLSRMSEREMKDRQEKGFEVVQNYDWKNAASKTKDIYLEILSNKSKK